MAFFEVRPILAIHGKFWAVVRRGSIIYGKKDRIKAVCYLRRTAVAIADRLMEEDIAHAA